MEQDRTESFASPLDEVLENIPQEDPPQELEQRCLDALGSASAQTPAHPNWWLPVRNVIAVAAALVLVVGSVTFIGGPGLRAREHARLASDSTVMEAPPPPDAPGMPGEIMAEEPMPRPAMPPAPAGDAYVALDEIAEAERTAPAGRMVLGAEQRTPSIPPRGCWRWALATWLGRSVVRGKKRVWIASRALPKRRRHRLPRPGRGG